MTPISALSVNDGTSPLNGTICFTAVDSYHNFIDLSRHGGGFFPKGRGFCQTLVGGALSGALAVPDSATDSAPGHLYQVQIIEPSASYTDIYYVGGVTGSNPWSLDNYVPPAVINAPSNFSWTVEAAPPIGACLGASLWTNTLTGVLSQCVAGVWQTVAGAPGSSATVNVGSVAAVAPGTAPAVTNTGTSSAAVLNFAIPQGQSGAAGLPATVNVGSVSSVAAGTAPAVTNTGTSSAAVLNFAIPQGQTGAAGLPATVNVGSVSAVAPGTAPAVTNTGTSSAAVLNFAIPQGQKGDTGPQGPGLTGYADVVHLFGSGACTGILYSDGTCGTAANAAYTATDANGKVIVAVPPIQSTSSGVQTLMVPNIPNTSGGGYVEIATPNTGGCGNHTMQFGDPLTFGVPGTSNSGWFENALFKCANAFQGNSLGSETVTDLSPGSYFGSGYVALNPHRTLTDLIARRSIAAGSSHVFQHAGVGDTQMDGYDYGSAFGGCYFYSDECNYYKGVHFGQSGYLTGTVTGSPTTGATILTTSSPNCGGANCGQFPTPQNYADGAYMFDQSRPGPTATIASTNNAAGALVAVVSAATVSPSTAWGALVSCTTNIYPSQEQTQNNTCTYNLAASNFSTVGNSPADFTTGMACQVGGFAELGITITSAPPSSGGLQTITYNTRYNWGHSVTPILMQGGPCGDAIVQTPTLGVWPVAWPVIGAFSTTAVVYGSCSLGACTGVNSTYNPSGPISFFPACEHIVQTQPNTVGSLECGANNVPWAAGDTVVEAPTSSYVQNLLYYSFGQQTPLDPSSPSNGMVLQDIGPVNVRAGLTIMNYIDTAEAQEAVRIFGNYNTDFNLDYGPENSGCIICIKLANPDSPSFTLISEYAQSALSWDSGNNAWVFGPQSDPFHVGGSNVAMGPAFTNARYNTNNTQFIASGGGTFNVQMGIAGSSPSAQNAIIFGNLQNSFFNDPAAAPILPYFRIGNDGTPALDIDAATNPGTTLTPTYTSLLHGLSNCLSILDSGACNAHTVNLGANFAVDTATGAVTTAGALIAASVAATNGYTGDVSVSGTVLHYAAGIITGIN